MTEAHFYFAMLPTLMTERLVLREVQQSDAAAVLVSFGDFEVQKYNGPVLDLNGVRELITGIRQAYVEKESLCGG